MANLDIRLLGAFYATLDGQPAKGLDQARLQSLLAFLLLHQDQPISRQQLAYTFWPDSTEKQALNNLRTLLHRLRQTLPDADSYLALERHTVQWRPEAPFTLDVADFEEAMGHALAAEESGDRQTVRSELERSVSLYSGDLLPANYSEWIEPRRERLRQTYMIAMDKLMAVLEEDEDYAGAINYARRLLQQNPLSEATYRRLMRLQVALGDRTAALQTFEQVQKMLAEKLGIDPSPQTLELHIRTLHCEIGISSEHREQQAQQVAQQQGKLDVQYDQLIQTNVLLIELQREREEKTKLLSRLEQATMEAPSPLELPGAAAAGEEGETAVTLCPYKGLVAYEEKDAAYFFGRENLVAELTARLAGTPFLTVVGPSGSGKSSVVRAGLLPALREDGVPGSRSWKSVVLTPGAQPLATLAVTVSKLNGTTAGKIYKQLQEDPRALSLAIEQALADQPGEVRILLVVDQFEEVFALCRDEVERRMFIESLLQAVDELDGRLLAVLTVRADFYGHCAEYLDLAATQKDSILLGPLDEDGLCQVIDKPAALVNLQLEPGLADTILNDVAGEPGALPLLSHALLETWRRREGRTLTLEGYRASGGISGAIAQTADSVYYQLTPEQQAMTRRIFLRLTELGEEGAQDTRRRVAPDELVLQPQDEAAVVAVLKTLTDARLITTGENSVEVAHEALIREWPQLRQWLEEDREGLRIHRHLTETAQAWAALDRDPGELYRGARLATASEWAEAHPNALNPLEHEFLAASQALVRQREEEREARRQQELEAAQRLAAEEQARADEQAEASKRLRRRAGYLTGALVVAAILALAALLLGRQANTNQQLAQNNAATAVAESNQRATAQADAVFQEEEARAQEAIAVTESEQRATAQAEAEFQEEQARAQEAIAVAESEQRATAQAQAEKQQQEAERQSQIAISRELAASSKVNADNDQELSILLAIQALQTAYSHEAEDALHLALSYPPVEMTLDGHLRGVTDVLYTSDGSHLATADRNGLVKFWDTATGKELQTLSGHTADASKFVFSPDETLLATAGADSTAKVWDLETGEELLTLPGHVGWVVGIAFSPDGTRLATGDDGGQVKIWDLASGEEVMILEGHTDWINEVAYIPDGSRLLSASSDGSVKIWDTNSGREVATFSGHDEGIYGMAFSPDWTYLATESFDNTVNVWDLSQLLSGGDSQLLLTISRNTGGTGASNATRMSFTPDGQRILTLDNDGDVSEWDVATGQLLRRVPCRSGAEFTLAVSPDGAHMAVSSESGIVKICSLLPIGELMARNYADQLYDVAFSPDGSRLYTAASSDGVKIWDLTGSETGTFGELVTAFEAEETGAFYDSMPSQDGTRLAIADGAGTTKIVNSKTWEELLTLPGHDGIVSDVAFSQDGTRMATSSLDNTVKMWDLVSGEELYTLDGHSDAVLEVAFNPDDKYMVTTSTDNTARLWDITSGRQLLSLDHGTAVHGTAFSPDGQILAIGDRDGVVHFWDFAGWVESGTMSELRQAIGHSNIIYAANFSPDGKYLATASRDQTARIWDVATGQALITLSDNNDRVIDVDFSPDGSLLATGGGDGTLRVYYLDPETLLESATTRITRWFTPEECRQFLNSDTCPPAPWDE